jgi:hypothetical protein
MDVENLRKLAAFLRTVPNEKFGMQRFADLRHENVWVATPQDVAQHGCGTAGCALGWSVSLFVPPKPRSCDNQLTMWKGHSYKHFGIRSGARWEWLFGGDWAEGDDTPDGAADRIDWLIEHGLPKDWKDQQCGEAPLCYRGTP